MENINELKMDTKRILECINYVEKQIKDDYIDLGLYDNAEIEVVAQAIKEFKSNHGLNDV